MKTHISITKLALSCLTALSISSMTASAALPPGILGGYIGIIAPNALTGGAGGRFDLTLTNAASITGSVRLAWQPVVALKGPVPTLSGSNYVGTLTSTSASYQPPMTVNYEINPVTNRFVVTGCTVTRTPNSANFNGWRKTNLLSAQAGVAGKYNFVLDTGSGNSATTPQGKCWGTFTVASTGGYSITGRTACDEPYTCQAFLGPDATNGPNVAIFSMMPSKSSLCGLFLLDTTNGNFLKNGTGAIQWYRPANASPTLYHSGFVITTAVAGGRYTPSTMVLSGWAGLHFFGNVAPAVTFTCSGLLPSPSGQDPDVTIPLSLTLPPNLTGSGGYGTMLPTGPTSTSLKYQVSTGNVVAPSQFKLTDTSNVNPPSIIRTAKVSGIAYPTPTSGLGSTVGGAAIGGYFLLSELPTSINVQDPVRSGSVVFQ